MAQTISPYPPFNPSVLTPTASFSPSEIPILSAAREAAVASGAMGTGAYTSTGPASAAPPSYSTVVGGLAWNISPQGTYEYAGPVPKYGWGDERDIIYRQMQGQPVSPTPAPLPTPTPSPTPVEAPAPTPVTPVTVPGATGWSTVSQLTSGANAPASTIVSASAPVTPTTTPGGSGWSSVSKLTSGSEAPTVIVTPAPATPSDLGSFVTTQYKDKFIPSPIVRPAETPVPYITPTILSSGGGGSSTPNYSPMPVNLTPVTSIIAKAASMSDLSTPSEVHPVAPATALNLSQFYQQPSGGIAGLSTTLKPAFNVPSPYSPTPAGAIAYLGPEITRQQEAIKAYAPNIATGTFVGSEAQYQDYSKKIAESNLAVSQYNVAVQAFNNPPPSAMSKYQPYMADFNRAESELAKAGEQGSIFTKFNVGVGEGILGMAKVGYATVSGLYGATQSPEVRKEIAGKLSGVPEVALMAVPSLITGSYETITRGGVESGLPRFAGQMVGAAVVFGAAESGLRSIPTAKMFGTTRSPLEVKVLGERPAPATPITREMIFGEGTLRPVENIVSNIVRTPERVASAISADKMFGRTTMEPVRNIASNIVETPSKIVSQIKPEKMFGTGYGETLRSITGEGGTRAPVPLTREAMFGTKPTVPKVPVRDVQSAYFEKVSSDIGWKDYEALKEANRWDIIDRKYPTPEPAPVQPKFVEGKVIPEQPGLIPEEWYGKSVEIGYGGEYSRVGIGGARSRLVEGKPISQPEVISPEWYEKSSGWSPEYTRIGYGGEYSRVMTAKDIVDVKPTTDIEIAEMTAKYREREAGLFPYGQKSELVDRLSTPGEESVPIPKARLPESSSMREGTTTIRRDLTSEMNKRFEEAQRLADKEAGAGFTTAQQGQVLILKGKSKLAPETKASGEETIIDLTKDTTQPVNLREALSVPEEWTGMATEIGYGGEYTRFESGGARSKIVLEKDLVKLKPDYSVPEERKLYPYGQYSKLTDRLVTPGEELIEIPKSRTPKTALLIEKPKQKEEQLQKKKSTELFQKDIGTTLKKRWDLEEKKISGEGQITRQGQIILQEPKVIEKPKQRQETKTQPILTPITRTRTITVEKPIEKVKSRQVIVPISRTRTISVERPILRGITVAKGRSVQKPITRQVSVITPKQRQRLIPRQIIETKPILYPKQVQKPIDKITPVEITEPILIITPENPQIPVTPTVPIVPTIPLVPTIPSTPIIPTTTKKPPRTPTVPIIPSLTITTTRKKQTGGGQGGEFFGGRGYGKVKSKRETPWHPAALEYVLTEEMQTGKLARHVRPKGVTQELYKQYAETGRPIPTAMQLKKRGRVKRGSIYG